MNLTYTKVLSRKILLAFLALTIILAITAVFVRSSISHKLENISKLAHHFGLNQAKPQHALLLVHEAEDDFQESLLNPDKNKNKSYKIKLSQAFIEIDSLLKEKPDTSVFTTAQYNKVHYWYRKKVQLSDRLYLLKHNFDSLLYVYAAANNAALKGYSPTIKSVHFNKSSTVNNSDTTKNSTKGKRKGLLGRLKDAIANKNGSPAASNTIQINHNRTNKTIDSIAHKILTTDKRSYVRKLRQLQQHYIKLLKTQKELITLNVHISNELENIINDETEINYNLQNEFNGIALKNYHDTTLLLNNFYLAALFLVLIFATLLIIFIIKLDKSEIYLLGENRRAVAIAQQKMDLLLHMSHEIRNPLTAIQGFLFIFSKTPLSPRQAEMLSSIRLSSDMLLRTLNDTLDAAKMETSEFKINNDPFNPDFALKEVIESMQFSASRKKLSVDYNFEGDKDAILLGDSFRLKQVMVNLLSNAIKYTKTGGITINANLELVDGTNRLHVNITDTGDGISIEQQGKLFSKYYQTSSAKGKTGTGLGLYICKELIELQKGKIVVKSETGKGATFSFYIPYQQNTENNADKQLTDDPLLLLNGIKILAVDDNEINLMFLKMMTNKWNVKFHEASNGKEALEILSKEDITLVLTDIQMPEMNGDALMNVIKQLKAPINKIPVIAITGESADNKEEFLKSGFAGLVSKPFVEADLVKEIVEAMKGYVSKVSSSK